MNDESKQLLLAVLDRLDVMHAEVKANTEQLVQVNQRLDRAEKTNEQINQRIETLEQRVAGLFDRITTLEDQMVAIGSELKQDIEKLSDRIQRMRIDFYDTGAEAARAIVVIKDFEKRIAALEAERRHA